MSEDIILSEPRETRLTPADLARSYLGHKGAEIIREIAAAENSRRFHETYNPKSPGAKPSWIEPGGMDESDWENEVGASSQYDDERDEFVSYWEKEIKRLQNEKGKLNVDFSKVSKGDPALIEIYSRLEKERREKIEAEAKRKEELEKRAEEERDEREMDGASEIYDGLLDIFNMSNQLKKSKAPKGWYIGTKENDRLILGFFREQQMNRSPLMIRYDVFKRPDGGMRVTIKDWREADELNDHPFNNSRHKARKGKYYVLTLNGPKVSYTQAGIVVDDQEEFPREEVQSRKENFGPDSLREIKEITNSAVKDIVSLGVAMSPDRTTQNES